MGLVVRKPAQPKKPRQPRRHGFARAGMTPGRRVEHALEQCPGCGIQLPGGWTQRTREVIELPQIPVQVTAHAYTARACAQCHRYCVPSSPLDGAVLGQQRLGIKRNFAPPSGSMVALYLVRIQPRRSRRGHSVGSSELARYRNWPVLVWRIRTFKEGGMITNLIRMMAVFAVLVAAVSGVVAIATVGTAQAGGDGSASVDLDAFTLPDYTRTCCARVW